MVNLYLQVTDWEQLPPHAPPEDTVQLRRPGLPALKQQHEPGAQVTEVTSALPGLLHVQLAPEQPQVIESAWARRAPMVPSKAPTAAPPIIRSALRRELGFASVRAMSSMK